MQQRTLTMEGENPLGVRPVKGLLFSFSIPAIISCLVNSVYNIVDQIFIGQGVGYLGNAATTIAFPLMTIIMAFATLIGSGGSAYAALRLGEGRKREALLTLNNLLVIAIGLGILLAATGLIFLKPILTLFGATETTMPYAIDYTSIVLMGVPFSVISIALSNMARTDGHPRMSMYGILIGAAIPAVFSAMLILGVDKNAQRMVAEIHRQFASIPGLKEGREDAKPEYGKCIDIATTGALRELIPAGLMSIVATLVVGFIGGPLAIGGFLLGNIVSGLLLALFMSNSGGLWDNSKKYVEAGNEGGKGSEAHKSAVIGDTVGDPFKDTAGPSINTQITVVSLVSSLLSSLFVLFSIFD